MRRVGIAADKARSHIGDRITTLFKVGQALKCRQLERLQVFQLLVQKQGRLGVKDIAVRLKTFPRNGIDHEILLKSSAPRLTEGLQGREGFDVASDAAQ